MNWYFQTSASTTMDKIIDLHNDIMLFLVFIFIFITWMLIRIIYLFRSETPETVRFRFQHNTRIEQVWTVIPALILLAIATPSFSLLYSLDETKTFFPWITVYVMGNQWYWNYDIAMDPGHTFEPYGVKFDSYMLNEEDLATGEFRLLEVDNIIYLPVNEPVRVIVSSADVLHSWAVPSLGIKIDACPGRINQISLCINKVGTFYGQCSELCGVQHSFMPVAITSYKGTNEFNEFFFPFFNSWRRKMILRKEELCWLIDNYETLNKKDMRKLHRWLFVLALPPGIILGFIFFCIYKYIRMQAW